MSLEGKTAVITGGNSGIGAAIAQEFSERGAKVVIFGRSQETLDSTLGTLGEQAHAVKGDVTNLADLDRLFAETQSKFGNVDVLVVNAGIGQIAPLAQMSEEQFDRLSDINFKGAFFTMQKGVNAANDGASVILVSSVANQMGMPGMGAYSATKAAVRNLARTATSEFAGRGIRVNSLSPGPIQTPIFDRMGLTAAEVEGFGEQIMAMHPMKRFGTPQEMAKVAAFLASSDSSYVSGTDLVAGGGIGEV
jgi:NAD(P)-dependent dehydrogenase (short-subunit alcohol dehydrogenase family)